MKSSDVMTITRPASLRYGLAVLTVAIALVLKLLLAPLIAEESPFLLFFAAVMVSAWYGGMGPGLLATTLAALVSDYFFLVPLYSFFGQSSGQNLRLCLFAVEGVLISSLSAALHTARRRAEVSKLKSQRHQEDLHQSEERYRLLVEGVRDYAIFMLDPDGYVVSWNPGAERIHGYRAEEVIGQHFARFSPRDDQENDLPASEFKIASQQGRFEKTELLLRKSGTDFWADVVITALRDKTDNLRGFAKVTRDITERRRTEESLQARAEELTQTTKKLARTATMLERRNRELDKFAYVLSHDLKAPLRAIANLSQWIEEDLTPPQPDPVVPPLTDEIRHHLNLLQGRVRRMEALIDGALQYSRIGRVQTQLEIVAVETLLTEVIHSLAPPPDIVEIGPAMPTLLTERLRLEQVFANLIGNAIKHYGNASETQGRLRVQVSAQDQGEFYKFTVADNGPGIPARYHEKVFEIFQTLEARDKVENSGIGLALVKKIVESKGGTIRLESQLEQGTTLHFTWPKQPSENP